MASLLAHNRSYSLLRRRLCPHQANVRSTTHLLGRTVKAGRGAGSTSSNTRTRREGGRTVEVVHPKVFSIQSLPFPAPLWPASSQTCARRGNWAFVCSGGSKRIT